MINTNATISAAVETTGRTFTAKLDFGSYSITNIQSLIRSHSISPNSNFSIGNAVSATLEVECYTGGNQNIEGVEFEASYFIGGGEIKIGKFTAEKPVKDGNLIKFTAYDRMKKAEKFTYTAGSALTNTTAAAAAEVVQILNNGGITISLDATSAGNVAINKASLSGMNCRDVLGYIAAQLGKNCIIDMNGLVKFVGFTTQTYTINNNFIDTPQIAENATSISAVYCTVDESTVLTSGSGTNSISFVCPTMTQSRLNLVLSAIQQINGYHAVSINQLCGDPRLEVGDIITLSQGGVNYQIPIMSVRQIYDGGISVEIASFDISRETELTLAEKIDLTFKAVQNPSTYAQAAAELSELIGNSLGLYQTVNTLADDSKEYYFHDKETLAQSTYIFTMTSNGFAWSNAWGGSKDSTTWTYGIDRDGNAVLKMLTAYKLSADLITTGKLQSKSGNLVTSEIDFDNGTFNLGNGAITYNPTDGLQISSNVVIGAVDEALADYDFSEYAVNITSQSVAYKTSTSGTTVPSGTWSTSIPTVAEGQYLWTRTTVNYSDGNSTTSYSVSYSGTNGSNGSNGTNGKGISSMTTYYKANNSSSTAPTSGWTTSASSAGLSSSNKYLWSYTVTTYTDGTSTTGDKFVIGVYGDKGDTGATGAAGQNGTNGTNGRGITSITHQYYLSTSQYSTTGGSWSDTPQTYVANRYYWERDHIVWNDGSNPTDTTAVLSRGLNKAILDANEANAAIGAWCYNNNKTYIDGGKIYTGTVTADKINVTDLFSKTITSTGNITLNQSFEDALSTTTTERNQVAQSMYSKNYSALTGLQKLLVILRILANIVNADLAGCFTVADSLGIASSKLSCLGLEVELGGSNSLYSKDAVVAGNLTVGGDIISGQRGSFSGNGGSVTLTLSSGAYKLKAIHYQGYSEYSLLYPVGNNAVGFLQAQSGSATYAPYISTNHTTTAGSGRLNFTDGADITLSAGSSMADGTVYWSLEKIG